MNAQSGVRILPVDALSGVDSPTSTLFQTIRYAVGRHVALGGTSRIEVRGRRSGPNAVLHTNALENWASGPIIVPPSLTIEWDTANSDLVSGAPTPVVLTGNALNAGSGSTAFQVSVNGAHTRSNTTIRGLQIVAFDVGIDWRPGNSGLTTVGVTLDSLVFNQCIRGLHVEPTVAATADPLVTACTFLNAAQPATIGGDRTAGLISLFAHVDLVGASPAKFRGDYTGCLFTANSASAGGAPIAVNAGFSCGVTGGTTVEFTVAECNFQGNGNGAVAAANGMLHGLYFAADGVITSANFLVRNSFFNACGFTGLTLIGRRQGTIKLLPPAEGGGWDYTPDETDFLTPEIRRCSFVGNGFVATAMPFFSLDLGHGVVTRTFNFGLMQPRINLCNATGTSAGLTNVGITGNALDGVYIHSDWWLPDVNDEYQAGGITFTRNDTQFETSRTYGNGLHGVEILLQEGSGNPGVRANRVYDNDANKADGLAGNGIHMVAMGATDWFIDTRDKAVVTPVAWNNFVYNLTTSRQQSGIFGRYFEQYFPLTTITNTTGGMGVVYNSSVNNAVNGINVVAAMVFTAQIESVESNIAFWNTGLDLVTANLNEHHNCSGNVTGGASDIQLDPLFINYLGGNLHLSITPPNVSPCIDQMTSWLPPPYWQLPDDFDLVARPLGPKFDMGADEAK